MGNVLLVHWSMYLDLVIDECCKPHPVHVYEGPPSPMQDMLSLSFHTFLSGPRHWVVLAIFQTSPGMHLYRPGSHKHINTSIQDFEATSYPL